MSGHHRSTERWRRALAVFKSFSLKASPDGSLALGIDVDPSSGRADTGDLELDLTELLLDLGEAARDEAVGVVFLFDEMQDLARTDLGADLYAAVDGQGRAITTKPIRCPASWPRSNFSRTTCSASTRWPGTRGCGRSRRGS